MDKTLILTVGISNSGKSTWAQGTGMPIVEPDAIRLALHGLTYRPESEPMVWAIAKLMVASLFHAGHSTVILSACNTTEYRRRDWNDKRWNVKYKLFPTPKEICLERAKSNNRNDLLPVIERMDKEIVWPNQNVLSCEEEYELLKDYAQYIK